jgi:hypothetical protein
MRPFLNGTGQTAFPVRLNFAAPTGTQRTAPRAKTIPVFAGVSPVPGTAPA